MLGSHRTTALIESLLLHCDGETPTERHFRAVAEAHGVSSRTVRRAAAAAFSVTSPDPVGPSAQAALDSLVGLDPRVVFKQEPYGHGWWPDLYVLQTLAAHPTMVTAHSALVREGHTVPSYDQFRRRLNSCLNPAYYAGVVRGGGATATAAFETYIKRALTPRMQVVEMDAFELPVDVVVPRSDKPRKPWLLLAIDRGTRAVPAWLIVPTRPTAADSRTLLALMALGTRCDDGTVIGGLPQFVMPDNGGEFVGWEFTTALTSLGISRLPVPPSTPHLKGVVERMGRHVQQRLIDTLPGATHGPELRHGEVPWRDVDLMALSELEGRVDEWFVNYNTHHRHPALKKATPLQAWLADATPIRQCTDAAVLRSLSPRVNRTISKKGVLLDYRHYIHPVLGGHIGTEVAVAWLPRHADQVDVFTTGGDWICTALDAEGLTDSEIDDLMTTRLRHARAVTAASRASADLRARLATLDTPSGAPPLAVADYLDARTDPGSGEKPEADSSGDALLDIMLGDDS